MIVSKQNNSIPASALTIRLGIFLLFVACILLSGFADALAATKKKKTAAKDAENPRYSAIVMDAQTGEILMARSADSIRHPASLTKMMTLYLLFEAIDSGRIKMSDRIPITSRAAGMAPSKLGLPAGSSIRVEDAIKALVTKSANDISTAIGEKIGGSEKRFAASMTSRARALGMSRTTFRNASGLPDPQQVTTARDMARLAMALLDDFPDHYHYFGIRNFEYKGAVHGNHNRLLGHYPGLDGIKTGYINASGFNLVASAKQNNRRLIGVVFGGRSWKSRNDHMVKLLDQGFVEIRKRKSPIQEASLAPANAPIPLPPPMLDDIRGVSPMMLSDVNSTDNAEEMPLGNSAAASSAAEATVAYTPIEVEALNPATAPSPLPQVNATAVSAAAAASQGGMIAQNDLQPLLEGEPATALSTTTTTTSRTTINAPIPVPRPAISSDSIVVEPKPTRVASAQMSPVGKKGAMERPDNTVSAPTVMQLTIKRDQLPAGITQQQIAGNNTGGRSWSIQVGAFHSRAMTDQALRTAQSRLPTHLRNAYPVIVPQNTGGAVLFRGRLQGFDEVQANAACAHLGACLVVAPGS